MKVNAGLLFQNAVALYQSISPESTTVRRDALSSIVLAAISSESFINELAEYAETLRSYQESHTWLHALADILSEAEDSRASIELKYQLAKFALSGASFDKGAKPYQDFALLIDVRNLLVHAKATDATLKKNEKGEFVWTNPAVIKRLQSAQIIKPDPKYAEAANHLGIDSMNSDLLAEICNQEVARWACRAVSTTVTVILDSIPIGSIFGNRVDMMYRHHFQVPQP